MGVRDRSVDNGPADDARVPLLHEAGEAARDAQAPQDTEQMLRNKAASTLPDGPPPPVRSPQTLAEASDRADRQENGAHEVHHVVLVQTTTFPPTVTCPYCHRQGPTIQFKASGFCTWFTASLCCFIGCCLLFPFVFCCDSLKDTVHYCSHCRRYLGRTPA